MKTDPEDVPISVVWYRSIIKALVSRFRGQTNIETLVTVYIRVVFLFLFIVRGSTNSLVLHLFERLMKNDLK